LGEQLRAKEGQLSDITAQMPEAGNKAISDRITHDRHDNWD